MVALALARWLLLALFRMPATWLALALAVAAGRVLPALTPSAHDPGGGLAWLARWSLPAGLLGAALATYQTRLNCTFLRRAASAASWWAHVLVLVAAAGGVQLALALGWWSFGGTAEGALPGLLAGLLVQDLHLATLGVLLLGIRLSPGTAAVALVVLTWTAARYTAAAGGNLLGPLLDLAGHPPRYAAFAANPSSTLLHSTPVASLVVCSWLARSRTAGSSPDPAE